MVWDWHHFMRASLILSCSPVSSSIFFRYLSIISSSVKHLVRYCPNYFKKKDTAQIKPRMHFSSISTRFSAEGFTFVCTPHAHTKLSALLISLLWFKFILLCNYIHLYDTVYLVYTHLRCFQWLSSVLSLRQY